MIHAVSHRTLIGSFLKDFQKGHFYMTIERLEEVYPGYTGFGIADRLMKRFPGEFKLVYQSRPFLNDTHPEEKVPYLSVFVLEKL
jgi:hypothetical protein